MKACDEDVRRGFVTRACVGDLYKITISAHFATCGEPGYKHSGGSSKSLGKKKDFYVLCHCQRPIDPITVLEIPSKVGPVKNQKGPIGSGKIYSLFREKNQTYH